MPKLTGLFAGLHISASGLGAQRRRMNTIAENLANTNTTRTERGGPYRRKVTSFSELRRSAIVSHTGRQDKLEVKVTRAGHIRPDSETGIGHKFSGVKIDTEEDVSAVEMIYNPDHPDADESGYVKMPKIDTVTEMVDMIAAARAYEANVTAIKATKEMAKKAMEI